MFFPLDREDSHSFSLLTDVESNLATSAIVRAPWVVDSSYSYVFGSEYLFLFTSFFFF